MWLKDPAAPAEGYGDRPVRDEAGHGMALRPGRSAESFSEISSALLLGDEVGVKSQVLVADVGPARIVTAAGSPTTSRRL